MKAYENLEFLHSPEARMIRVLCEFEETERRLKNHKIRDTIVFFGSARALPGERAREELKNLRKAGRKEFRSAKEFNAALKRAEQRVALSRYYDEAVILSEKLTRWSMGLPEKSHRFLICSGGGPGIMEAANRGASENAGGLSVGFNISMPADEPPNPYISPDLSFMFHYFFVRKYWFTYLAKALIIFPGGFGTMDELFEVLTLVQTRKVKKEIPIVIYGRKYWDDIMNIDAMLKWGTISQDNLKLFRFCDTPNEAYQFLTKELTRIYLKPGSQPRVRYR